MSLPNPIFTDGWNLYPFQAEGVEATVFQRPDNSLDSMMLIYSMGTGKTVCSISSSSLMLDESMVDQVIVVAENNKVIDWHKEDYPRFTNLPAVFYGGTPKKRAQILDEARESDCPPVLVMTYEMGRQDLVLWKSAKRSTGISGPGPLAEYLSDKKVAVIFDEVSRLRGRTSRLYHAWYYLLNRYLPKVGHKPFAIGLTGTPVETSPIDIFNIGRILAPSLSPTVKQFETDHVASWDIYGNPSKFKNLSPQGCDPGVTPLSERYAPIIIKKSKTDPDVIDQFPSRIERSPRFLTMGKKHAEFYGAIQEILLDRESEGEDSRYGISLLRQVAAAPAAIIHSEGALAREVVSQVGQSALVGMGSAKLDEMVAWANEVGDQKGVLFTFFGQSVLREAHQRLRAEGFDVVLNHGQMSAKDRQQSQDAFKHGDAQFFLSSDAGMRGLNLGAGSALLHLELPLTQAAFDQRSDRCHRIDSKHPSVTIDSLVMQGTVETAIQNMMLQRGMWAEEIIEGGSVSQSDIQSEGQMTASMRSLLWKEARSLAG